MYNLLSNYKNYCQAKKTEIIKRIDLDRKPGFSLIKLNVARMSPGEDHSFRRHLTLFQLPISTTLT